MRTLRPACRSLTCARLGRSQMDPDELHDDFCAAIASYIRNCGGADQLDLQHGLPTALGAGGVPSHRMLVPP